MLSHLNYTALSVLDSSKDFHLKEDLPLSDYSKNDAVWDEKRRHTELLGQYLEHFDEFKKWGERCVSCAEILTFRFEVNKETGELKLKLNQANFCRVRHCPVCNWRRSMRLQACFYNFLPSFLEKNPKSRFIFMTLTAPNVPITELDSQLVKMNQAWQRFSQRKVFTNRVKGFVRATEVTREKRRKNYAHPHFHVLLQVDSSYFKGGNYLSQEKWLDLWRHAMRDDSITQVDVRAVKGDITKDNVINEISKTFNYSIEAEQYEKPDAWLLEYFRQVHRKRFIVSGGSLKNAIKDIREDEESNDDLINTDDDNSEPDLKEEEKLYFGWRNKEFVYKKTNPFKHD